MAAEKETREKEFVYSIGTHYYMDYLDQNEKETLKGERQTEKAKRKFKDNYFFKSYEERFGVERK